MADSGEPRGRSLSRRQFDEVIRRATELAADEVEGGGGSLSEAEIYRIAQDVGLGERYVRQALAEVGTEHPSSPLLDRAIGPALVHASRIVPGGVEALADRLDEFMVAGRLLQRVRRSANFLQYRPSVDWISQIARAASATSKKYFVAAARSVEIRLEAIDEDRTLVEFLVDPGIRDDHVAGLAIGGGLATVGSGVGAGFGVAMLAPELLAVAAGGLVATAAGALSLRIASRRYRRKFLSVRAEVEGLLDRLEAGDMLEPPPSSWRRWVERQFHGARRLLDPDGKYNA